MASIVTQSSQEGVDFESTISSGSVSEGSSDCSLMPMAYSFEPSVTDSGSSSETSSDESEVRLSSDGKSVIKLFM